MKLTSSTSTLATALVAAALLTGCGSARLPDPVLGGGRDSDGRYDQRVGDLRGTVNRVDTRSRLIVVDREDTGGRYDLRNGNDNSRQAYLNYDDRTTVAFQGRTFRPEDLEAGDRIAAELDQDGYGERLVARDIQVLYDVSSGNGTTWDRGDRNGNRDDGTWGRDDRNDRNDGSDRDDRSATDLRGTVRYLDTRNQTLEIDRSGYSSNFSTSGSAGQSGNVVVVHYDANTEVRYQGRSYRPENLERGDVVEIDLRRNLGGDLLAQEIVVVRNGATR